MNTGSVFTLISAEDDVTSKYLMATSLLRTRLAGLNQPLLKDLERTHVLFVNSHYSPYVAIAFEYRKAASNLNFIGEQETTAEIRIDHFGDFINDMVLHMRFRPIEQQGTSLYRFCALPGIRMIKRAEFKIASEILFEYDTNDMLMYNNFGVDANKRATWNRCIGHGDMKYGTYYNWDAKITQVFHYFDGAQSFSESKEGLELWIPLRFDFCKDVRKSFPSVSVSELQRFVNLTFAPINEIIQFVDNNMNPIALPINQLQLLNCDLYYNNIFVNSEVTDLYVNRVGFSLIRTHRQHRTILTTPTKQQWLDKIKYPVETLYIGFKPTANASNFDDWFRFATCNQKEVALPQFFFNSKANIHQLAVKTGIYAETTSTVPNLSLKIKGIDVFKKVGSRFYSDYLPFRFGSGITASEDGSLMMMNFNLYPGSQQPSGYHQSTATREMYLTYDNANISVQQPVELIVSAVVINFMHINKAAVYLEFAT